MSRNQPDNTERIVATISHSKAKKSGKTTAKFCVIKVVNLKPPEYSLQRGKATVPLCWPHHRATA